MYDKQGRVLRLETVINRPQEFSVRRRAWHHGQSLVKWRPMGKGIANFYRFAEIGAAINARYLDALAAVDDVSRAQKHLDRLGQSAGFHGRPRRALNPLRPQDIELFRTVLQGDYVVHGFRNSDLVHQLFGPPSDEPLLRRRRSADVTRRIQLLRAHGLIAKYPHARRYHPTVDGYAAMAALLHLRLHQWPEAIHALAS